MHSSKRLGTLFVVATPIGNLQDITLRALEVLRRVSVIACEDTRRTAKLLNHYRIEGKRLLSCHEHNEERRAREILRELEGGRDVALVSDAGTPCISDPGYKVVKSAREKGVKVVPIPGPSAVVTALSGAGFPSDRFYFAGFLPRKEQKLLSTLKRLTAMDCTVVCYESPHRIERTLTALSAVSPGAEVALYRELTKVNEEFLHGKVEDVLKELKSRGTVKGEIVLLIPPATETPLDPTKLLKELKEKGYSLRSAVKEVQEVTGIPKSRLYRLALKLFGY